MTEQADRFVRCAMLQLECIGDDTAQLLGVRWTQPWVAELTGFSKQHRYRRLFLRGQKDYTQANSMGSRGVYEHFLLEPGRVYEVYARLTWHRSDRYFCRVDADGGVERIDEVEVRRHLLGPIVGREADF
jgi:hypothetical protein